jgi:hypothetical protein
MCIASTDFGMDIDLAFGHKGTKTPRFLINLGVFVPSWLNKTSLLRSVLSAIGEEAADHATDVVDGAAVVVAV